MASSPEQPGKPISSNHDVGSQLARQAHPFHYVGGLGDYHHVGLVFDQHAHASPDYGVIVDQFNAYLLHWDSLTILAKAS